MARTSAEAASCKEQSDRHYTASERKALLEKWYAKEKE